MLTFERWTALIERYHRAILVLSLVLVVLSGLSLRALRFDFDVLDMLPTGTPAFDDFKRLLAEFGELDELIILLQGDDPDVLRSFADGFGERVRDLGEVERVQVKEDPKAIIAGVLGRFAVNYLPEDAFRRLESATDPAALDAMMKENRRLLQAPMDLSAARLVQLDPLGLLRLTMGSIEAALGPTTMGLADGYVSSADGRALLIFVRPKRSAFDIVFTTLLMEGVRRSEEATRAALAAEDVRVGYTGSYAFALEDAATIRRDVRGYAVLALVAVVAVFYLGYRNLRILPFVTYPLLMTALLTFSLSLVLFDSLNAVSISFAAILYGLSIDSGIHYYTRLLQEARTADGRVAVERTLRALAGANVVASMTTAAVFAIIGFSVLAGVRQLGILTALGMLVNLVQFFLIYPALTFFMPAITARGRSLETPRLGHLAAACARHRSAIVMVAIVVAMASLYGASRVTISADLFGLRPAHSEAEEVQRRIEALFGAPIGGGAVLVTGPRLQPLLETSEAITERLGRYQADGEIVSERSVTTLLPSEATQRARLRRFADLPRRKIGEEVRAAMARHGFVPARFDEFFDWLSDPGTEVVTPRSDALDPFRLILERYVRERAEELTIATYVQPRAGMSLEHIESRLRHDLGAGDLVVAGRSRLEEELSRVLRQELVAFLALALSANLILVWMNFRRPLVSLAVVTPQILVLSLCLSAMFLCGIPIGPVNLIVFPLVLGIGIDDCVYLAERYVQGEDIEASVRFGGRALVITSLTTMAGFGFLGASRYPALSEMGALSAAGLLLCLAGALTLLPALLGPNPPGGKGGAH